mgnify:CR=1 FL=1
MKKKEPQESNNDEFVVDLESKEHSASVQKLSDEEKLQMRKLQKKFSSFYLVLY